jgi:hypothetical protein
MKGNRAVAIVLVALMTVAFSGMAIAERPDDAGGNGAHGENGNGDRPDEPGSFYLNQSVVFGEKVVYESVNNGIYMDGTLINVDVPYYNEDYPKYLDMYSKDVVVQADWSDNLVLHEWRAGSKIRTEVILQDVLDPSIAVFTIRATFMIEYVNAAGEYVPIWNGATANGLWVDQQPEYFYSAEVNQLGMLLYGYNWDSAVVGEGPGTYRLTFTIGAEPCEAYPAVEDPAYGTSVDYNSITIDKMIDPEMYGPDAEVPSENFSLDDWYCDSTTTWIEIELF